MISLKQIILHSFLAFSNPLILKAQGHEIKYDTIPTSNSVECLESTHEILFRYKVLDKEGNLELVLSEIRIREDKFNEKEMIMQEALTEIKKRNEKIKFLNNMNSQEKYNYFKDKYFSQKRVFEYCGEYIYFNIFKELNGLENRDFLSR